MEKIGHHKLEILLSEVLPGCELCPLVDVIQEMAPPGLVRLQNISLLDDPVQLAVKEAHMLEVSPIDFPREDLSTVSTGGGELSVLPLYKLGEVTLGRDELHWVELVLDLGEAVEAPGQQGRAGSDHQHSEDRAAVATSHQVTPELRKTVGK